MFLKKNLANILTLTNFTLGIIAILLSNTQYNLGPKFLLPCVLIITAAFLDRFDGKMARKLNTVSDLGKQLDSLSDLVSFGVAPAVLSFQIYQSALQDNIFIQIIFYLIILFFPLAGALRLAKFNIQDDTSFFIGIPITLAGGLTALINLCYISFNWQSLVAKFIVIFIGILAVLMISKIKLQKR